MKIAVLFPGQGSQFLGMGKEFMESSQECREIMSLAEEVCQTPLGNMCLRGPMEELTFAINLQPAITAVNLMCWRMLSDGLAGKYPVSYVAGHSLGEYSALCAAGVINVADTIKLVAKRGALMHREGEKNPGGMRAVVGLTIEEVENLVKECDGYGVVTAANHNTAQQIVVSGSMQGLDALAEKAEALGARVIALNVSVANHSPLVANAVPDFASFMDTIEFKQPSIPVIFNVSARKESETKTIKEMMARQIASRVRWYETIQTMLDDGVDTFIEAGPKNVLKGMMRKLVPKGKKVNTLQFDTPETLLNCLNSLN